LSRKGGSSREKPRIPKKETPSREKKEKRRRFFIPYIREKKKRNRAPEKGKEKFSLSLEGKEEGEGLLFQEKGK